MPTIRTSEINQIMTFPGPETLKVHAGPFCPVAETCDAHDRCPVAAGKLKRRDFTVQQSPYVDNLTTREMLDIALKKAGAEGIVLGLRINRDMGNPRVETINSRTLVKKPLPDRICPINWSLTIEAIYNLERAKRIKATDRSFPLV